MNFPDLTLSSAALLIFLICIGFVLIRGAIRLLVGVIVICASAWAGFQVWQFSPTVSITLLQKPVDWIVIGLPIVAFVGTFTILRLIANFFTRPFGPPSGSRGPIKTIFLGIFTLIPAGLLWTIGATLIHHFGSIAEIEASTKSPAATESTVSATTRQWKDVLVSLIPAKWLSKLDPLADPERLSLAKLIASQSERELEPVIDPETGKPYPRAIIVDDPELQTLAHHGRFDVLLRHPLFQKAMENPKILRALKDQQDFR